MEFHADGALPVCGKGVVRESAGSAPYWDSSIGHRKKKRQATGEKERKAQNRSKREGSRLTERSATSVSKGAAVVARLTETGV